MKRLALLTLLPFFLFTFLALMPFASASAQSHNIVFTAPIRTDRGSVQMAFRTREDTPFAAIGYEEYSHPAIPATTEGEIFVPDSVVGSDGRHRRIRWVSRGSFQGCKRLTKIHLPFNISTISDLAFQGCDSLREVTLPDSLRIIYPQAFYGCFALRRINLRCPNPPLTYYEGTFENHSFNTATIVVPFGSVDSYRNDKTFSSFRYHAEHIPTFPKRQP